MLHITMQNRNQYSGKEIKILHNDKIREHATEKKNVFFRALPESPLPPPPLVSGNLYLFFRTSKTTFCAYGRKNANYDNDGPMIIMMVILMIMITKNDQITYKY